MNQAVYSKQAVIFGWIIIQLFSSRAANHGSVLKLKIVRGRGIFFQFPVSTEKLGRDGYGEDNEIYFNNL